MTGLLVRLLVTAGALAAATWLLPGIRVDDAASLLLTALVFGLVNAVVRPLVLLLSLPLILLTLGLFLLVVNALMLLLADALVPGFQVDGFWAALVGAVVVSVVGWALSALLPD